jgi:hypothetical protein
MISYEWPLLLCILIAIAMESLGWFAYSTPRPKKPKLGTIDWSPEWNYHPEQSKLTTHEIRK